MALRFAGFNGRPIAASTGVKAPIVLDESRGAYALVSKYGFGDWHHEAEVASYEAQALLSRAPSDAPFTEGFTALYAHMRFIASENEGAIALASGGLELYPALESYVAFLPKDQAIGIMHGWGRSLLGAAHAALKNVRLSSSARGQIAFWESMRARTAFPMSSSRREDRIEIFALACVGWILMRKNHEPLLVDSELEGLRADVGIRVGGLLRSLPPRVGAEPRYLDGYDAGQRHLEDAA